jgi:hypothetical protein
MSLKQSAIIFAALAASQISQAAISNAPMYGKQCPGFNLKDIKGDVFFSNDCGSAFIGPGPIGKLYVSSEYVDRSVCDEYEMYMEWARDTRDPTWAKLASGLPGAKINFTIETGWDDTVEAARQANRTKSIHKMNILKAGPGISKDGNYEIPGISNDSASKLVGAAGGVYTLTPAQTCSSKDRTASEILSAVPLNVFYSYRPYTDFAYTAEFDSNYFVSSLKANVKGSFMDFLHGDANIQAKTFTVNRLFKFKIDGAPGRIYTAEFIRETGEKKLLQYLEEMAEFVACSADNQVMVKNLINENGALREVAGEICRDIQFDTLPGGGMSSDLKLSEGTKNLEKSLTEIYCTKTVGATEVEDKECRNAKAISKVLLLSEIVIKADITSLNVDYKAKEHIQTFDYVELHQSTAFKAQAEN